MPPRPLRLAVPLAAALLAVALTSHAAGPCPANLVWMGGAYGSSTAAVFDSVGERGEVRWDMGAGRVYILSYGWLGGVYVETSDDYDVTGVPPGTPVSMTAELTVDGAVWTTGCSGTGCGGFYWVDFIHGPDSLRVTHNDHLFIGRLDHHDVLRLPLTIVAGQPERLRMVAQAVRNPGGAHLSEANSVLRFPGLEVGVGVTSCKGFAGTVVPVRPTSWGRLKSIYR